MVRVPVVACVSACGRLGFDPIGSPPISSCTNIGYPSVPWSSTGSDPRGLAIADFDGDRNLDLVTANPGNSTAMVALGRGTGEFAPAVAVPALIQTPNTVAVGDLDADGDIDLVLGSTGGTATVALGAGAWLAIYIVAAASILGFVGWQLVAHKGDLLELVLDYLVARDWAS